MTNSYIILDLDGTLLFAEERPNALMVPGRRRNSYMATETIELLKIIQVRRQIVLATGRSRASVVAIIEDLRAAGVRISGSTAENGGIWIDESGIAVFFTEREWIRRAKRIEEHMAGMIQNEFESCVALLKPDQPALDRLDELTSQWGLEHRRLRDGNKLFILAPGIDKKHALELMLGGEALNGAWGAGNDLNDLDWMREVEWSAAPACARDELLHSINEKQGMISVQRGHAGIAEILTAMAGMS